MVSATRYLASSTIVARSYTSRESRVQQVLVATTALTSFVLGFITFYWFLRIKRTFRHQLIVLLVVANMVKALGYLVYPIIELTQNSAYMSRPLCIANGFNLSWGIEAADFVILLIALHTALTVFRPRTTAERTGLYPFRITAYISLIVFPTLLASLAFIDTSFPYTSSGAFCYLPTRPIWYRLALSWVPRYLILLTIVAVYLAIYMYARYKFNDFEEKISGNSSSALTTQQEEAHSQPLTDNSRRHANLACESSKSTPLSGDQACQCKSNASVYQRHKNIKHQLRLMFIYPMVYFLLLIPPFVNHCWLYTKNYSPPFALTTIAVVCLAGQGAVDSVIFMTREKPWRHAKVHSNPLVRANDSHGDGVRTDGIELVPQGVVMTSQAREGLAEPREWWDQAVYSLEDAPSEGSRARHSE